MGGRGSSSGMGSAAKSGGGASIPAKDVSIAANIYEAENGGTNVQLDRFFNPDGKEISSYDYKEDLKSVGAKYIGDGQWMISLDKVSTVKEYQQEIIKKLSPMIKSFNFDKGAQKDLLKKLDAHAVNLYKQGKLKK